MLIGLAFLWMCRRQGHPGAPRASAKRAPAIRHTEAAALAKQLEKRLTALGFPKPPHLTPWEHLQTLRRNPVFSWADAAAVVRRYHEIRFGNRRFQPGEQRTLKRRIRKLGRA